MESEPCLYNPYCCTNNLCPDHRPPGKFYGPDLILGCQTPNGDTILQTIDVCRDHCLRTCQISLTNTRSFKIPSLKRQKPGLKKSQEQSPFHFYVRAPRVLEHSPSPLSNQKSTKCLEDLLGELSGIDCSVVTQVGCKGTPEDIVEKLNTLTTRPDAPTILLENASSSGINLGANLNGLRILAEGVDRGVKLGFCINTAHLFTAGEMDVGNEHHLEEIFDFLSDYDHRMIHLNDSATEFGSNREEYESLGCGYIWGGGLDSLQTLLHFSLADKIPVILETPSSLEDMKLISSLI